VRGRVVGLRMRKGNTQQSEEATTTTKLERHLSDSHTQHAAREAECPATF
jgi:hypothetical protein